MRTRVGLLLGALAAALCLGAPAALAAEPAHPFRGTITGEKIGPFEQFRDACGVATDSKGDIYVADYYGNRVVVFNDKEEYLTQINGINPLDPSGVAPVGGPCDLAVDATGRVYVNNYHRDVVRYAPSKFPPEKGTTYGAATTIDEANHPTGVAVDASGNVYVNERTAVAVFDPAGVELTRIGSGSLEDGYGVAVSTFGATAGYVYAADAADGAVEVYDPLTSLTSPIETIDGAGTPRDGFRSLVDTDLAVDPADGHLYVVDTLKPHFEKPEAIVYEYSAQGNYRDQVPHPAAEGENSFLVSGEPSGVAIGTDGDVYVTSGNGDNAALFVFGPADPSPTQVLDLTKTGAGAGTVASTPASLRCGTACEGEFNKDSTATLTATPAPHSRLVGWTGCDSEPTPNLCQVTMNADRSVSAEFEPIPQQTLTVSKTGAGTVASSPAGIECGGACASGFDEGSAVTLTAAPAAGSRFAGWSGCDSEPTATSCAVTMAAARAVDATFELEPPPEPPPPPGAQPRTLTVASTALGTAAGTVRSTPGGIDCGSSCSHVYERGTQLTLVAEPGPGSVFLGWGGCEAASGTSCTLALGADRVVVAAFAPGPAGPLRVRKAVVKRGVATLTVAVPGPGTLVASGKWLSSTRTLPLDAGDVTMRLGLSPAGRRALAGAKGNRLKTKVRLGFAPLDGGTGLKATRKLVFGGGS
jgi:Divergent InlB B-repeat domain/NHL repeat